MFSEARHPTVGRCLCRSLAALRAWAIRLGFKGLGLKARVSEHVGCSFRVQGFGVCGVGVWVYLRVYGFKSLQGLDSGIGGLEFTGLRLERLQGLQV